jgi:hypothetical protein
MVPSCIDRYGPGVVGSGPQHLNLAARPTRARASGGGRTEHDGERRGAVASSPAQPLNRARLHDSEHGLH